MKARFICIVACLTALLVATPVFAGKPSLTTMQVVEIANDAAKANKELLDRYLPPKASYDSRTDTWWVYYGSKVPMPGNFFSISVHDKTKEAKVSPGA